MVTTAFCVFGYWLIGRLVSERRPSTRISRLMVGASTGLRMKRSVKFMRVRSFFLRCRARIVRPLHCVADCDRRTVLQLHLAAGHDVGSGLQALDDGNLVAAGRTGRHEHL